MIFETDVCNRCLTRKPNTEFHRNKCRKSGLHAYCKMCRKLNETLNIPRKTDRRTNPAPAECSKRCTRCRQWKTSDHFRYRSDRPDRRQARCISCEQLEGLEFRKARRERILDHYGRSCAYCGDTRTDYLEVDHIQNDGKFHRQRNGENANEICGWLITRNFPSGYQILCTKCNLAKSRFSGEMPMPFTEVGSLAWKQAIEWLVGQMGGRDAFLAQVELLPPT